MNYKHVFGTIPRQWTMTDQDITNQIRKNTLVLLPFMKR